MKFQPGDRVQVRRRERAGHHRTPAFIQGKRGIVEGIHGAFPNPESRAYGGDGLPAVPLYLVRFDQGEVWEGYEGSGDQILLDLYEPWLEALTGGDG